MLTRYYKWRDYKITKDQRHILADKAQDPEYRYLVTMCAYLTDSFIADWLIISVTEHKTYEAVEFDGKLGRIPIGRTDFYGKRRLFYYNFKKLGGL